MRRLARAWVWINPPCVAREEANIRHGLDVLERAVENASYALDPNQGERPDPVLAQRWLHTAFPEDHPNYVDPATLPGDFYGGPR